MIGVIITFPTGAQYIWTTLWSYVGVYWNKFHVPSILNAKLTFSVFLHISRIESNFFSSNIGLILRLVCVCVMKSY